MRTRNTRGRQLPATRGQKYQLLIERGMAVERWTMPRGSDLPTTYNLMDDFVEAFPTLSTTVYRSGGEVFQFLDDPPERRVFPSDDLSARADYIECQIADFDKRLRVEAASLNSILLVLTGRDPFEVVLIADNVNVDAHCGQILREWFRRRTTDAGNMSRLALVTPSEMGAWESSEAGLAERKRAMIALSSALDSWQLSPASHDHTDPKGTRIYRCSVTVPNGYHLLMHNAVTFEAPSSVLLLALLAREVSTSTALPLTVNTSVSNRHSPTFRSAALTMAQRTPIALTVNPDNFRSTVTNTLISMTAQHPHQGRYDAEDYLRLVGASCSSENIPRPAIAYNFVPIHEGDDVVDVDHRPRVHSASKRLPYTIRSTRELSYEYCLSFSARPDSQGGMVLSIHGATPCLPPELASLILTNIAAHLV